MYSKRHPAAEIAVLFTNKTSAHASPEANRKTGSRSCRADPLSQLAASEVSR